MKRLINKTFLKLAVISFFLTLSFQSQASIIYANGPMTSNTVWSADTVIVNGDITVNSGVTLTIDPGTRVIFQGHYKINVNGRILAVGLENDLIRFTINDTTGFSNMTSNNGGWYGIRFFDNISIDSSKIIYCSFTNGKANGTGDDANGGAIFVKDFSKLIVANCTFDHNAAKTNGGGIYLRKSNALIQGNTFTNNKSSSGGGIYISLGIPLIYNNAMISNFSSFGGGGIFCADTTLARVNGNLIRHNMGQIGGGVGCYYANPTLNNNTIIFNNSTNGGALSCIFSSPTLINNILYSNTASSLGKQVALLNDQSDPNFYYCDIKGGFAAFGIQGTQTYTGTYLNNIAVLPQFEDTILHNYMIKQTSPCMDAGTPDTTGLKLISVDIANKPRINMARIDIGAYERQQVVNVCGNITQNTLWNADTVKITCDIVINNGVALTINPKVYIQTQGIYSITVNGRILANGIATDSIIFTSKNTTNGWKGIIFNNTSVSNDTSKFSFCSFSYAKNNSDSGGAMYVKNFSKIKIYNSLFKSNFAYSGGAIYAYNSVLNIANTSFRNNNANTGAGKGGAIFCNSNSNLQISKCLFAYNGSFSGGSIYTQFSEPVIKLSIISNSSATNGGGVTCDTSNAKIINCIIVNNSSTNAGGIYAYHCNPDITNSTISYNNATNGGGIMFTRARPKLTNTILYSNLAITSGNQAYLFDTISAPKFYYCDVQGDTTAIGKNGFSHFHGIYQNNKDTIPAFMAPSAGAGISYPGLNSNWALDACSNLYNKGNPDTNGLKLPLLDFGGNVRIYANRIDIGAYELIKPHIVIQPATSTFCTGDTAAFSVSVESSYPVNYLWEFSSTFGVFWNSAPGVNNDSVYVINGITGSQDGYYYRCVITASCSQSLNSQYAILHVNTPPSINSQPVSLTICQNANASFTVGASGTNISYQWQQQPPSSTWANCTGATATQSTYTITNALPNLNGYKYHCIITGDCEPDTITIDVLLTVKAKPLVTNQPSNQSACQGQNVTFSLIATGTNILYQWEESTDGGSTWHNAPGTSTATSYTINGIIPSQSGYRYRCVITGDCTPPATSNVVTLSVNTSPAIITQPLNTNVCVNSDTSIRVIASGGNLTFQWEKKSPGGLIWSNAPGPTNVSAIYQIDNASLALNGTWYRCHVQNICPPDTMSDSVQLFVHALPTVYIGPDASILLYDESIVIDAGGGFTSYYWSTGESTQSITIVGIDAGIGSHMYTVTVTNSYGCTATDNITITVINNTGISITESETNINIYPNPTNNLLYLDIKNNSEPIVITITNIEGQLIFSNIIETSIKQKVIDLSEFSKGIYLVTITLNGRTYKEKIVKL